MELGHPQDPGVIIGPVIDADAHERLLQTQRRAADRFRVRSWRDEVPEGGWYVGPMIVDEVPASDPLATDEHFGPVLVVAPADSIDDAFAMANATDYALTAGLYSRSPVTIARAGRELRAGNIYLNRGTTGAVVGRQPFGGFGLSGIGSKAGGPDYLAAVLRSRGRHREHPAPGLRRRPAHRLATGARDGEPRPARRGGPRS